MFRKMYDWVMRLAASRHAPRSLAVISFAESSFFPIPPDVMLVPMILANRDKAYRIAAVCTIASVAGGAVGYGIGYFLYDSVGQWLVRLYGAQEAIAEFRRWYAEWGAAVILIKGLTPIPFKLVTIASGFAGYDLLWFVVLSIITRGFRFFLVAELLRHYGEPIRDFIDRRLSLVTTGLVVIVVAGFVIARYAV